MLSLAHSGASECSGICNVEERFANTAWLTSSSCPCQLWLLRDGHWNGEASIQYFGSRAENTCQIVLRFLSCFRNQISATTRGYNRRRAVGTVTDGRGTAAGLGLFKFKFDVKCFCFRCVGVCRVSTALVGREGNCGYTVCTRTPGPFLIQQAAAVPVKSSCLKKPHCCMIQGC
jgi:hypothetical protein